MLELTSQQEAAPHRVEEDAEALRGRVQALLAETRYEDLEHADIGLQFVLHAVEETLEHKGLAGDIPHTPDAAAHARAESWLNDVKRIHAEATELLAAHPNGDLETAIKALTVATRSLEEVAERYE
ncbi:MAG TPA: hypothetical protein VJB57_18715 [Dehalococcoidia bacterium]|nr:hypothetical protein [Dehalococcoidia bacterium]